MLKPSHECEGQGRVDVRQATMRIGELSERTGASRRLLRYYEEQGLIAPDRQPNGYRDYDERLVDRVLQIRGLLESGLPTRMIKKILPCLTVPGILYCPEEATPEMVAALEAERDRLTQRIQFLTRNRDAITEYVQAARRLRTLLVWATYFGCATCLGFRTLPGYREAY
jgi:DNA-binding transcriptional MerR regulator